MAILPKEGQRIPSPQTQHSPAQVVGTPGLESWLKTGTSDKLILYRDFAWRQQRPSIAPKDLWARAVKIDPEMETDVQDFEKNISDPQGLT